MPKTYIIKKEESCRNVSLSLLICFFLPSFCLAQRTHEVTLSFEKEDFQLTEALSGYFVKSDKADFFLDGRADERALPHTYINILIAPNEYYDGIDYYSNKITFAAGIEVVPNEAPIPTSMLEQAKDAQRTSQITPLRTVKQVEFTGDHYIDGFHYLSFSVCPFDYDESSKTLSFSPTLNIEIHIGTQRGNNNSSRILRPSSRALVRNMINNKEDIDSLYSSNTYRSSNTIDSIDYMIITSNALKDSFQPLLNWKKKKGVRSIMLSKEDIYSHYSGSNGHQKIKSAIKYYHDNHALKYVLIGGDVNIVPAFYCYIKYITYDTIYFDTAPTDYYFSCTQTLNWDTNGNELNGEYEDSVDLSPTVAVSRIPVSTSTDVTTFVNRIIQYEKEPSTADWENNILMSGYRTYNINGQIVCKAQLKSNWIYQDYIMPYWSGERFQFFTTGHDFNDGLQHPLTPPNLQERFSTGYLLTNILTHGSPSDWGLPNEAPYDTAYAKALINPRNTIIVTSACFTSAIDYAGLCLAEAFVRNPNSGILAYVGCTRLGWSSKLDNVLGASNEYSARFYQRLFTNQDKNFGDIARWMKIDMLSKFMSYNYVYRWLLFGINPIGDPEMPVFILEPQRFEPPTVTRTNGHIIITCNVDNCRICIMSPSDNGSTYYKVVNQTNSAVFDIPTDCYSVCITKQGYIPYIVNIINKDYIQNEFLEGNNIYVSDITNIGKDVNLNQPVGPVSIEDGYTHIMLNNGVTIKNSFNVKKGATFEIK